MLDFGTGSDLGRGRELARRAQRWSAQRQRAAEHFVRDSSALWVSCFFSVGEQRSYGGGICWAKEQLVASQN